MHSTDHFAIIYIFSWNFRFETPESGRTSITRPQQKVGACPRSDASYAYILAHRSAITTATSPLFFCNQCAKRTHCWYNVDAFRMCNFLKFPQNSCVLIPYLLNYSSKFVMSIMDENLIRWNPYHNHRVAKSINVSLTLASTSGVVVLNVLWRMTLDMSNRAVAAGFWLVRQISHLPLAKFGFWVSGG